MDPNIEGGESSQLDPETEEPTLDEYARFHGLVQNHRALDPLSSDNLPPFLEETSLDNDEDAVFSGLSSDVVDVSERLFCDKATACMLSKTIFAPPDADIIHCISTDHRHARKLKLEPPILHTDHELDIRNFGPHLEPDIEHVNLPLQRVDEERDEGLTWPSSSYKLPRQYDAKVDAERLEVPKGALQPLQAVRNDTFTVEDEEAVITAALSYKKRERQILEPLTPPLLPSSPFAAPFVPSSPTARLELLSDHSNFATTELQYIKSKLAREDGLFPSNEDDSGGFEPAADESLQELAHIYSPIRSSPPSNRKPAYQKKMSSPILPLGSSPPSNSVTKTVSFKELLREVIPDVPRPIPRQDEDLSSEKSVSAFIHDDIKPIADRVNRRLEQEQLQEADATKRVKVPLIDMTPPIPPWKEYSHEQSNRFVKASDEFSQQRNMIKYIKDTCFRTSSVLSKPKTMEKDMRWLPFPLKFANAADKEDIHDDDSLTALLAEATLNDGFDTHSLTWKPNGLRILDDSEQDTDDEELQPAAVDLKAGNGAAPLVQERRKRRASEVVLETAQLDPNEGFSFEDLGNNGQKHKKQKPPVIQQRWGPETSSILGGSCSAVTSALSSFMATRSRAVTTQALKESPHFSQPASMTALDSSDQQATLEAAPTTNDEPQSSPTVPLPAPELGDLRARPVIVSSTLLSQRSIMRRLRRLYPNVELIERDFTIHLRSKTTPAKESMGPPPSPGHVFSDEADLILSPSTGLIWTTIQKVKQRSLPGQAPRSVVRERIARIYPRYERLLVLVSEGRIVSPKSNVGSTTHVPNSKLNETDCVALVELTGFAAGLDGDVGVLYVGGGEEELVSWIVGAMRRHGVVDETVKLLQEETLVSPKSFALPFRPRLNVIEWEVFLRRAGMNAFAAQVVLADLKPPEDVPTQPEDEVPNFGLTAFITMSVEQRMRKYETMLGGKRMLTRVSRVLDSRWQ
ncbi:MAG: hypothetical protein M1833_001034 [Piccolia ochrophora]|nr:MAG: hypothetical protein M1833_001034 [Piccolia ochrophora]